MDNGAAVALAKPEAGSVERPGELGAVGLGFAIGWGRILRRSGILAVGLGLALAVAGGIIERRLTLAGATDRALAGTFRLLIPLVSYAMVAQATERSRLRDSVWPVARYGVSRASSALGVAAAGLCASMAASALFALVSVMTAYSRVSPPLALDAWQGMWIGAITAGAYAGWFAFGATFFSRGGGRLVPLVADFLIGATTSVAAAALPHAHARNLLGSAFGPAGLTQRGSSAVLCVMAIALCLAAAVRSRE